MLLTGERTEHQLVVDRLNTSLYEIHSVKQVKGMLPDGNPVIFSSLQADVHYDCEREPAGYTLHRRREPSPSKYNNPHLPNEDTFIAISPGKSGIDIDDITSLSVEALVCERHLVPAHLQQPHFQLETAMPIHQVEIVRYPSNPVAVPNISQAWQAIQMLASNPLRHARPDVQDCSALLRDWLSLFCHQDDSSQRKRIASIKTPGWSTTSNAIRGRGRSPDPRGRDRRQPKRQSSCRSRRLSVRQNIAPRAEPIRRSKPNVEHEAVAGWGNPRRLGALYYG